MEALLLLLDVVVLAAMLVWVATNDDAGTDRTVSGLFRYRQNRAARPPAPEGPAGRHGRA